MIIYYCKEDIISNNKKTLYAKQGDEVFIIANHYPALIVCNYIGEKFPCHTDKLSKTKINKNATKSQDMVKTNRNRKH